MTLLKKLKAYLDIFSLQIIDGLFVLLPHIAAGRAANKILPRAAQAVAEARLPHRVVVHPLTASLF